MIITVYRYEDGHIRFEGADITRKQLAKLLIEGCDLIMKEGHIIQEERTSRLSGDTYIADIYAEEINDKSH